MIPTPHSTTRTDTLLPLPTLIRPPRRRAGHDAADDTRRRGNQRILERGEAQIAQGREIGDHRHPTEAAGEILETDRARHAKVGMPRDADHPEGEIGRASWRERGCQYVLISVVADTLKKKTKKN